MNQTVSNYWRAHVSFINKLISCSIYNLMTTAHEICHTFQLSVTDRLPWHIPGCAESDSEEKEAASFSHVLPHVTSPSMAQLMTLAAIHCLHLACNHWPTPKRPPIRSFQSVFSASSYFVGSGENMFWERRCGMFSLIVTAGAVCPTTAQLVGLSRCGNSLDNYPEQWLYWRWI